MRVPSCPHCGSDLPQYRNVSLPGRAAPGQIALCMFCESFSVIANDLSLRTPNSHEAASIARDPGAERAIAALRAIKAAARGGQDYGAVAPACPSCGVASRGATGRDGLPAIPKAGDFNICLRCGCVSRYTLTLAGLFLNPLTALEQAMIIAARARLN